MRKVLSVLLCFCLMVSTLTFTQTSVSAEIFNEFAYGVLSDGTVVVGAYRGSDTEFVDVVIPSEINGYTVTSINQYAFDNCTTLKSVTIPNTVTSIGECAFYGCTSLTSIIIPNSVKSIGKYAFGDCKSLKNITIGNGVTHVGEGAFCFTGYYNNPSNWKSDVLYIGPCLVSGEFKRSYGTISEVTGSHSIKKGTRVIADNAFDMCSKLTSVTIPNSVTSIGNYAFRGCALLESITIPNSVTSIGDWAFSGCYSFKSIVIPNSITVLPESVFENCDSLESVLIPDSIIVIKNNAFNVYRYGDSGLKLKDIYYTGTQEQWYNIDIFSENSILTVVNIHYNAKFIPKKPTAKTIAPTKPVIATQTLKTPNVKFTAGKKQIKIKYTKVKNAVGFQVKYKIGKKTVIKTFNTKKSVTKTIKKLKKGKYKIQIRAFAKGKKLFSNWTKVKTVKVK